MQISVCHPSNGLGRWVKVYVCIAIGRDALRRQEANAVDYNVWEGNNNYIDASTGNVRQDCC